MSLPPNSLFSHLLIFLAHPSPCPVASFILLFSLPFSSTLLRAVQSLFSVFFCLLFFFFLSLPRTPYCYSFTPSSSLIDIRFVCPQLIFILSLYIAQDTEEARRYSSFLCCRFFFLRVRKNAECFDPRSHTHIFHFFTSEVFHQLPPPLSFHLFLFSFHPPLLMLILAILDVVSSFSFSTTFFFLFSSSTFLFFFSLEHLPSQFISSTATERSSPLQSRERNRSGAP